MLAIAQIRIKLYTFPHWALAALCRRGPAITLGSFEEPSSVLMFRYHPWLRYDRGFSAIHPERGRAPSFPGECMRSVWACRIGERASLNGNYRISSVLSALLFVVLFSLSNLLLYIIVVFLLFYISYLVPAQRATE